MQWIGWTGNLPFRARTIGELKLYFFFRLTFLLAVSSSPF
jgi:hypothetical protein